MRVAAVVVTFNRLKLVGKSLAAVEAQQRLPEALFIVDNASTDGTAEYLRTRSYRVPTTVRTMRSNTGGAGGFYAGMQAAYDAGYDAVWIMDDDTAPRPQALGQLVDAMQDAASYRGGQMPSYASSFVLWDTDKSACQMNFPTPRWDWVRPLAEGKRYIDLDCASFVSCLITREAMEACGMPHPEYFIWFDDAEYTYRLSKWRPGIFVPDSKADHMMPANSAAFWGQVDQKSLWKFGYGARNQVAAALSLRRLDILASQFQNMTSQLVLHSQVPLELRCKLFKAAASGLFFRPQVRFPQHHKRGSGRG